MVNLEYHKNPRVRQAYKIAKEAHKYQKDKAGAEYINHPMAVASDVGDNVSAIILALLHDIIEDHSDKYNLNILKREVHLGVYEVVALKLLTHEEGVPYFDYIKAIKSNELATMVKLADLRHNSDLSRFAVITPKDEQRLNKYKTAIAMLNDTENDNAD